MERWYLLVRQALLTAWRRRWVLVATAWVVCLIGWVGVYRIPDSYESQTRLYVDADSVLTPLLHGLAIDTATANQLDIMQRTLLSRPNLEKLIGMTDLNLSLTDPQQRDRLVIRLGREITVASEGRNLFTVTYRNNDRKLAHDVVAGLANIFMERANASNRAEMNNAQKFLNQQIAFYEVQLRAAEQRRADFRRKYLDILPLESNGGISRLDSARVAVRDLGSELRDALEKRTAFREAERVTPRVVTPAMGVGGGISPQDPLTAAEAKLSELRVRFTDQNPDVIIARQLVDSLRASPNRMAATPTPKIGERTLANPGYEQVKLRLIEAETTVSSLQARLDTARTDLTRMEELARAAPQVDAEYQDLDRGYNVLRKNYEELLARRESSNITAAADTGADKVRFRVVDPPQLPSTPVAPNRLMLISLVFVAGLGAAIGLGIAFSQMDQSISDVGHLRDFGLPVLGGISVVPSSFHRHWVPSHGLGIVASILLLMLIYGGLAGQIITHYKVFL
jgi:polysaccharide chain length determinant protein (PEP-CTERM system associated)